MSGFYPGLILEMFSSLDFVPGFVLEIFPNLGFYPGNDSHPGFGPGFCLGLSWILFPAWVLCVVYFLFGIQTSE